MAKLLCHLPMKVNHAIVANFYVANMSFNAIRENKILAKISKFTVYCTCYKKFSTFIMLNISHVLHSSLIIVLFNWQHSSVKNCG